MIQVGRWVADGDRIVGHKVGLSSRAMQRQMRVDRPDFGHLTQSMAFTDEAPITAGFLQPRIEPEIALVLGRGLSGPGVTLAQAISAVDYVLPALEIIDSRIANWRIGIVDTVADNASSGGFVVGQRPRLLREVDLAFAGAVLTRDGEIVGTGAGGAVLGGPLNSLVWLANTLGGFGESLAAGSVVLPGSMTKAVPVTRGCSFHLQVAGLGHVSAVFA
ncbi:2-keto-4-pentenoate hydratase [Microbacterium sp. CPCC 204701]|uniref:2-keto-4-pentenoate hydratase n=1 Tax=Microbacterium sp. CPCC 204701 TaxID=2493084 RepID=UPI001F0CA7FD|nr:fumarylacetoacetate hydrolase family protein [Microbacterium sp. CPCC 204701]